MVLPGAVAPSTEGTVQSALPRPKQKIVVNKVAGEEAVAGRSLHLNGAYGAIEMVKSGDHLDLTKLTLAGNMISRPGDNCQVDVVSRAPEPLTPLGKPNGVLRYQDAMSACPFSFDILPGAIMLKTETEICTFKAADCQVRPSGMWGPAAESIGPDQISADIRARNLAETALRASFRDLMDRHRDRATISKLASEQAAFSSDREDMCRDYVREDQHGFCDARYTEAKVSDLRMRLGEKSGIGVGALKPKPKKRRTAPHPAMSETPLQLN